ncbi:hypothetical protein J1614_009267 [Plenodomus biglobosus]|nr:hypothetical protein J1614_009267 [Plenodomus biglobosus]
MRRVDRVEMVDEVRGNTRDDRRRRLTIQGPLNLLGATRRIAELGDGGDGDYGDYGTMYRYGDKSWGRRPTVDNVQNGRVCARRASIESGQLSAMASRWSTSPMA